MTTPPWLVRALAAVGAAALLARTAAAFLAYLRPLLELEAIIGRFKPASILRRRQSSLKISVLAASLPVRDLVECLSDA